MASPLDHLLAYLLEHGTLTYDPRTGHVYSPNALNPSKPVGHTHRDGYLHYSIKLPSGRVVKPKVHRIACIAAHGLPAPPRTSVNHANGDKTDNRATNLAWSTHQENMAHAFESGLLGRDTRGRFSRAKDPA